MALIWNDLINGKSILNADDINKIANSLIDTQNDVNDLTINVETTNKKVETISKRVENIENSFKDEYFKEDNEYAYVKQVPSNSLPYCELKEIKGKSYINNGELVDSKVTSLKITGSNLIQFPYYNEDGFENNGIVYRVYDDGTIVANGTAYGTSTFILRSEAQPIYIGANKTITLTGCPAGGSTSSYRIMIQDPSYKNAGNDIGNGVTIQTKTYDSYYIFIIISEGTTVDGLTFSPMLNYGDVKIPFEPYKTNILNIPEQVLRRTDFGYGIDDIYYNRLIFDNGKVYYFENCYKRKYMEGDEYIPNYLTDHNDTIVPYETSDPSIGTMQDVTEYFEYDNFLPVYPNGTIIFENDYKYPINSKITFALDLEK